MPLLTMEARLAGLDRRLARALTLTVTATEPGVYLVTGGSDPHWVAPAKRWAPRCDCADFTYREGMCAHRLAVALHLARGTAEEKCAQVRRWVTKSAEWAQAVA